jgi:hypothetical protein
MKDLQKMGGIAALYEAMVYVAAIVFFLFVVDYPSIVEPGQKVALLVDYQLSIYVMMLLAYVVFGLFLVVLALALYQRLKAGSPAMAQTATALGLIWAGLVIASGMVHNIGMGTVVDLYYTDPAQAALVWTAIDSVVNGLGGEMEIVGGLWTLLISGAALRAKALPRGLNYLGLVVGLAGILSAVPGLLMLNGVFGLSQIVWFVWLGIVMLRSRPDAAVQHRAQMAG